MAGKKPSPDATSLQAAILLPCLQRPAVAARVHELLGLDDDETAAVLIAKLVNPHLKLEERQEQRVRQIKKAETLKGYKDDGMLPKVL